ncbi:arsenate reductase family protein [Flavobacterium sp. J49]|uniref:arsenate reductase family protein n=1 Tax=Flavobacterium sp. J49 TaxID=2718534 RepID=UPI00159409C0|nr:arsenate reductase family protein [Flavobacterium sp. J49]MBF6640882.1 arsenate reductase family protein [Flavobacterium sp. J49]NIC02129.1 arsenate reductase family protein [Flavobacterium sp. J49]
MLQILHNPRCGKSRNCLAFLENSKVEYEIRNYLQNPLSESELNELITKLNLKPIVLVRQKETVWIENFKGKTLTDKQIIKALAEYPILIERPIVINGPKAIIGRDLEKLEKFL